MFRRRKPPLRYFLYVSDAKLDMLFEQIDPALRRRVGAEAKTVSHLGFFVSRLRQVTAAARVANAANRSPRRS
jgi:hypothetical protein